jgi:exopolysaccharide biosynthesis polyprenyl glycosylphosphotransferase
MLERSSARYVIALYLSDLLLTLLALYMARWLRVALPYGKLLNEEGAALAWPMFVAAAVIWSVAWTSLKAYNPQRLTHVVDELQTVISTASISTIVLAGVLYLTYRGLSRLLYGYFFGLDLVFCLLARLILRQLMRNRHATRHRGVLIVGTGSVAQRVARSLQPTAWMGIEVVGYLAEEATKVGQVLEGRPILGTLDQASAIVAQMGVREIVIALPMDVHRRLVNLVAALQELPVNIKVVPDYSEMVFLRATLEQFGGVLFIGLKEPVIGPIDRTLKRFFDIVVSALGLVVLSPLLGGIALLVKLSSPGPVFYPSPRIGEGGRPFRMWKFRTMVQDADQREQELIATTADGKLVFNKRPNDPRITLLGRFLRRYSLDEFPQLFNVLVGEMSLVGPRPELPALVQYYEPWQQKRFSVPQGMTGWWQIAGRGNKPKYLHVEDDLYYIQNYSLWLDLIVIWRTLGAVIKGEGAF